MAKKYHDIPILFAVDINIRDDYYWLTNKLSNEYLLVNIKWRFIFINRNMVFVNDAKLKTTEKWYFSVTKLEKDIIYIGFRLDLT